MSVENIRKRVELARTHDGHEITIMLPGEHVSLTTGEAEALCELADAARDAAETYTIDGATYCAACDLFADPAMECPCEHGRIRSILARLEGGV